MTLFVQIPISAFAAKIDHTVHLFVSIAHLKHRMTLISFSSLTSAPNLIVPQVETLPRKGTLVRAITIDDAYGYLLIREALECTAARLYCGEKVSAAEAFIKNDDKTSSTPHKMKRLAFVLLCAPEDFFLPGGRCTPIEDDQPTFGTAEGVHVSGQLVLTFLSIGHLPAMIKSRKYIRYPTTCSSRSRTFSMNTL